MLKKLTNFLPAFLITLVKLFLLEFFVLSFCRCMFYYCFKTIDSAATDWMVILKAFRMGFEFDMVVSTYALFLPAFLLVLNEFIYKKNLIRSQIKLCCYCTYFLFVWLNFNG